jgi:hypothetical protein
LSFTNTRNPRYVVGNFDSLATCSSSAGRHLWTQLREHAEKSGSLLDYFPAKCERHGVVHHMKSAADFAELAPDGGCTATCDTVLPCGHACPFKCHPGGDHARVKCTMSVPDVCGYGHPGNRKCSETSVTCRKFVEWKCLRGHTLHGKCSGGRPTRCRTCTDLDKHEEAALSETVKQSEKKAALEQQLAEKKSELDRKRGAKASVDDVAMMEEELRLAEEALRALSEGVDAASVDAVKSGPALTTPNGDASSVDVQSSAPTVQRKKSKPIADLPTLESPAAASREGGNTVAAVDGELDEPKQVKVRPVPKPRRQATSPQAVSADSSTLPTTAKSAAADGADVVGAAPAATVTVVSARAGSIPRACELSADADFAEALQQFSSEE